MLTTQYRKTLPFSLISLLLYPHSHASLNSSKIKKVSESIPINRWLENNNNSITKLKKEKEKKIGSGEDPGEDPCATATKTISYFKFSQPVFRKIRKPHKLHIDIIKKGIMLTNQYRSPPGNLYCFLNKSASLFILYYDISRVVVKH